MLRREQLKANELADKINKYACGLGVVERVWLGYTADYVENLDYVDAIEDLDRQIDHFKKKIQKLYNIKEEIIDLQKQVNS